MVYTTAVGVAHFALPLLDAHNHRPRGNVDQEVECGTTHGSFLFYGTSFPFFFQVERQIIYGRNPPTAGQFSSLMFASLDIALQLKDLITG